MHTCVTLFKELVQPKMKIIPWFTHPQAILSVYDFIRSAKHIQSLIKKKNPGNYYTEQ